MGAACLIDRSKGQAKVGTRLVSLAGLHVESFSGDKIPADLANIPAIKPGSRGLV